MRFSTMFEWLNWISSVHTSEIELGLERVKEVALRLNILTPPCPVIVVGGTNGKGSTVAGLEAIYRAGGYHVGTFTSPILFKHNEQVRIDGQSPSDEAFLQSFNKIEMTRGNISLTPFEFHTLAALLIFQQHKLDLWILEVGLGGRLDAVNIIDADVAIVTSVSLDHEAWLGSTREAIGYEKAGIFRKDKRAVCGDFDPPSSIIKHANALGTKLLCQGRDFHYRDDSSHWSWTDSKNNYAVLPYPSLNIQNMSTVLMVITLLQNHFPVSSSAIFKGLAEARLPGRVEVHHEPVMKIYDVSHNPAAVSLLAKQLKKISCTGKTYGVFSMLGDKDIVESIRQGRASIEKWYVAPLADKRAASKEQLLNAFQKVEINEVDFFSSIPEAYQVAIQKAQPGDRIVVFGSFHTVAEVNFAFR